jgi:hypothetical protein
MGINSRGGFYFIFIPLATAAPPRMSSTTNQPETLPSDPPAYNSLSSALATMDLTNQGSVEEKSAPKQLTKAPLIPVQCFSCVATAKQAELGLVIEATTGTVQSGHRSQLPNMSWKPQAFVCMSCWNEGLAAKLDPKNNRSWIVRLPLLDDKPENAESLYKNVGYDDKGNAWVPLFFTAEHWRRPASKQQKPKKSQPAAPLLLSVLMDHSGSMNGERIGACRKALQSLLTLAVARCRYTTFSTVNNIKTVIPGKEINKDNLAAVIADLTSQRQCGGSTAFWSALYRELIEVGNLLEQHKGSRVVLVALTDGEDNDSSPGDKERCATLAKEMSMKGNWRVEVISVGHLSNAGDIDTFVAVCPKGSRRVAADGASTTEIGEAFDSVRQRFLLQPTQGVAQGASSILPSALSLIASGVNGNLQPELIWRVGARLLNLGMVNWAKGDKVERVDVEAYFHIQRTLYQMLAEHPEIIKSIVDTFDRFSDPSMPNERRKDAVPDLGEAFQLFGVGGVQAQLKDSRAFLEAFYQEFFRRNAKSIPMPTQAEVQSLSKEDLLKRMFSTRNNRGGLVFGLRLLAMNLAVSNMFNRDREASLSYYNEHQVFSWQNEAIDQLLRIAAMSDPHDCLQAVGLPPDANDVYRLVSYGRAHSAEPTLPTPGSLFLEPTTQIGTTFVKLGEQVLPDAVPLQPELPDWVSHLSKVQFDVDSNQSILNQSSWTLTKDASARDDDWKGVQIQRPGTAAPQHHFELQFKPVDGALKGRGNTGQQKAPMATLRMTGNSRGHFEALPRQYAGYATSGKHHLAASDQYLDNPEGGLDLGCSFTVEFTAEGKLTVSQRGVTKYTTEFTDPNVVLAIAFKNGTVFLKKL